MLSYVFLTLLGVTYTAYTAEKVNLGLYSESLWPFCVDYFKDELNTAWQCSNWTNMVNISIYPYGNAEENQLSNGTWNITCQHGIHECQGNLVETCFINLVSFDQNKFMDFLINYEIELDKNKRNPFGVAQQLLESGNYAVTWDELNSCINSMQGNEWEHQMGLWSKEVHVLLHGTPMITINGVYSESVQNECQEVSTIECTCKVYNGSNSCCDQYYKKQQQKRKNNVCYKDD